MIEREAAYPADRAKIAAVIYNRLHAGMPLGIDATIQYRVGSWRALNGARPAGQGRLQHAHPPRPAADADLQPRAGVAAGRRAPRERAVPVLRRDPRRSQARATTSRARSPTSSASSRRIRHDHLRRDARRLRDRRPGRALALAAHAQRGLARRSGSTASTSRCAWRPPIWPRRCAACGRSASTASTSRCRTRRRAVALCDELGPEARDAGAVNTLSFPAEGGIRGDLTDGLGLLAALTEVPERAVVLGAGGSARAAGAALLRAGTRRLTVVARRLESADRLADALAELVTGARSTPRRRCPTGAAVCSSTARPWAASPRSSSFRCLPM